MQEFSEARQQLSIFICKYRFEVLLWEGRQGRSGGEEEEKKRRRRRPMTEA